MNDSTVCPFCNTRHVGARCPSCGRAAAPSLAAPAPAPTPAVPVSAAGRAAGSAGQGFDPEWDAVEPANVELSRGGSAAASGGGAYAGAPASFGDDDPFADDVPAATLELDRPPSPAAAPAPSGGSGVASPPGSVTGSALATNASGRASPPAPALTNPSLDARRTSAPSTNGPHAYDPQASADPAGLIARFPPPPTQIWGAPAYAVSVLLRKIELRRELASLRRRRSPDVPLFERALKMHDPKMFTSGLALTGAALVLGLLLFLLPVIARFAGAPD